MEKRGDAYIAAHPVRYRILRLLAKRQETAEKLAQKVKLSPVLVYFHLTTLRQHGLVKTNPDYVLGNPPEDPRAVLEFSLTDEGRELSDKLEGVYT